MTKIDYKALGFRDARHFSEYHFDKFEPEQQEILRAIGICPENEKKQLKP